MAGNKFTLQIILAILVTVWAPAIATSISIKHASFVDQMEGADTILTGVIQNIKPAIDPKTGIICGNSVKVADLEILAHDEDAYPISTLNNLEYLPVHNEVSIGQKVLFSLYTANHNKRIGTPLSLNGSVVNFPVPDTCLDFALPQTGLGVSNMWIVESFQFIPELEVDEQIYKIGDAIRIPSIDLIDGERTPKIDPHLLSGIIGWVSNDNTVFLCASRQACIEKGTSAMLSEQALHRHKSYTLPAKEYYLDIRALIPVFKKTHDQP